MTTDDIDTMTGPELSAAVAVEVMGWGIMHPTGMVESWFSGINSGHIEFEADCRNWQPHSDRNDAHRVLIRCEELGIRRSIWTMVSNSIPDNVFRGWGLLTIDPAIICRAALRAVREANP